MDFFTCRKKSYLRAHGQEINDDRQLIEDFNASKFKTNATEIIVNGEKGPGIKFVKNKAFGDIVADLLIYYSKDEIEMIEFVAKVIHEPGIELSWLAYKWHTMQAMGMKITRFTIVSLSEKYTGSETGEEMLAEFDATNAIRKRSPAIPQKLKLISVEIENKNVLAKDIGKYCIDPKDCVYKNSCWENIRKDVTGFDFHSIERKRKLLLYYNEIHQIENIPQMYLGGADKIRRKCLLACKNHINGPKILEYLSPIKEVPELPVYYLSFGYEEHLVAPFQGLSNGSFLPFFCHLETVDYSKNKRSANSFFNNNNLESFLDRLIKALSENADSPIVIYSGYKVFQAFNNLQKIFPAYEKQISEIKQRTTDLMTVFKKAYYYEPEFKTSYRLENLVPVLYPQIDESKLEILLNVNPYAEFIKYRTAGKTEASKIIESYFKIRTEIILNLVLTLEIKATTQMDNS